MKKSSGRNPKDRSLCSEVKDAISGHLHIILLIVFFSVLYETMPAIHISELHFTMYYTGVLYSIVLIYVVWLGGFRNFRKKNYGGNAMRCLFDLIPAEVFMMLVFAQWHFWIAVFCVVLWAVFMAGIAIFLMRWEYGPGSDDRPGKNYHYSVGRIAVFSMTAVFAVPCFLAVFVYELQPPVYTSDESVAAALIDASGEEDVAGEAEDGLEADIYQQNIELLSCFSEDRWSDYSTTEKISLMKKLADMEAEILGIPAVPVSAALLDLMVLGLYDTETNEIYIDVTYLEGEDYFYLGESVEECVITICHEMFHAYQQYCIDCVDWDSELAQTHYFDELRAWYENSYDYKDASSDGYDEYAEQALEESAQEYAEKEMERIYAYISS